jgi:hypothetical protein
MRRLLILLATVLLTGCASTLSSTRDFRTRPLLHFAGSQGNPLPEEPSLRLYRRVSRVFLLYDLAYWVKDLREVYSSHTQCLARGYSESQCLSVAKYCAFNVAPTFGVAGTLYDLYSLNQVFKVDCGNGECFACCFVPAGGGCHTAFHSESGLPVINCNPLYGAGTKEVGLALVTDPNAQPGQGCLFTPQTCEHLGICHSGLSAGQVTAINDDPGHIMKSGPAVRSRARNFGVGVMADWSNLLAAHHTSADSPTDTMRDHVRPLSTFGNFITGRGCAGWRHRFPSTFPSDWSEPQFRIDDANGAYAEEPSHVNGVRQLGTVRLIGSIPNLYDRLAYVESRIWTPAAAAQYLAPAGNADAAMLQYLSPLALDIFRRNRQVQNYRLLAVPLPGERDPGRIFNGCALGDPPVLSVSHQKRGTLGIDLQVSAIDSRTSTAAEIELLAIWGDGSVTRKTVAASGQTQIVSHDYAAGGRYQVMVMVQNEAGLRTIGALVADTASIGTNPANRPVPVISEIQLVDLRAEIQSFAGNALTMMFELELRPSETGGFLAGMSRALPVELNTPVRFGTIAGWNMAAFPIRAVTIRPYRFGDGVLLGFNQNFFTLDRVRAGVYSTEDGRMRFHDVAITSDMVRLYRTGSNVPIALSQPAYGSDGRLQIPVEAGGLRYARIDLLFPDAALAKMVQGPVADGAWEGVTGIVPEERPIEELAVVRQRSAVRP